MRTIWGLAFLALVGCGDGAIGGQPGHHHDDDSSWNSTSSGSTSNGAGAAGSGGNGTGAGGSGVIDADSLRARVSDELGFLGAAIDVEALKADATYRALAAKELNSLTPENAMKWGPLEPIQGSPDFAAADALVEFAEDNGQVVHGHALVWHSQLPDWMNGALTPEQVGQALDHHIDAVVGRYKGRLRSWDVVNEAVDDGGGLRQTIFLEKLGPSYIAQAFTRARAADPAALLFYNDYGIEFPNAKVDGVYALLEQLKASGVPVDGVGLQFHVMAYDFASFDLLESEMRSVIQRFASLGLLVRLSELDVRIANLPDSAQALEFQRDVYGVITNVCRTEPACSELTMWGLSDNHSWIDTWFGPDDPLLFNDLYARKPAYFGVADAMDGKPVGDLDLGLDTRCGTTLGSAAWCAPFEALDAAHDYTAITSGAVVAMDTTSPYRGARALLASTPLESGAQAVVGRRAVGPLASGSVHLRAYVYVPSGQADSLALMAIGEANPPYDGVSVNLSQGLIQLSLTTAGQFPVSGVAFPKDSWHCVQLDVQIDGAGGSATVSLDGSAVITQSGVDTFPVGGMSNGNVGILWVAPGAGAAQARFDEVALATAPLPCD